VPNRAVLTAAAALVVLLLTPSAAAASTTVVEVEPANGATLDHAPGAVTLTFDADLDPARCSASLTPPGQDDWDAVARVDGPRLVVEVPTSAEGDYVVSYTVAAAGADAGEGEVSGSVGFTVAADGATAQAGGTAPWTLAAVAVVAGLVAVLLLTVRGWRTSRERAEEPRSDDIGRRPDDDPRPDDRPGGRT
jgi:methionine-rich copper-binding protein CopC